MTDRELNVKMRAIYFTLGLFFLLGVLLMFVGSLLRDPARKILSKPCAVETTPTGLTCLNFGDHFVCNNNGKEYRYDKAGNLVSGHAIP